MSSSIASLLPPLYTKWLPALFGEPAPTESKATCESCAMCAPRELGLTPDDAVDHGFFRPSTKCCTYHPKLPNYLVGGVLSDESGDVTEGQVRLRDKIETRRGITPRWIAPPGKYALLHEASRGAAFGRSEALLCPMYQKEDGLCSVWRYRDGDCSTFFCKYDAGAAGRDFWRALGGYLEWLEMTLSRHAILQVDERLWSAAKESKRYKPSSLSREELEERSPHPSQYQLLWGEWVGREEDFYRACYDVVAGLDADAFQELVDRDDGAGATRLESLTTCYTAIAAPALPERLIRNPDLHLQQAAPGHKLVNSYSAYDPLMLPDELLMSLGAFTSERTVAEARDALQAEHGMEFDDEGLIELHQYRLLIEPDQDDGPHR